MSSTPRNVQAEIDFVARFIEACGTSKPTEIKRSLNISYQAAKNYLHGRVPNPDVLVRVSGVRGYSIHWLLTGAGERLVCDPPSAEAPRSADELRKFVREILVEVIEEQKEHRSKVVELQPEDVISETVDDAIPMKS